VRLAERLKTESYTNREGFLVFTEKAHLQRGTCCGCGCLHCPYLPKAIAGNTRVDPRLAARFEAPTQFQD